MYPHLISVIFKSEGEEAFGVLSIAVSYPFPNADKETNGAKAEAIAALPKNFRRDVELFIINY
jgi:hypothetical protein